MACSSVCEMVCAYERDNGYDNRMAGFNSPSQNRENPPLRFMVLLSRERFLCKESFVGFAVSHENDTTP